MIKNINDININYVDYGDKNSWPIVLLHGWGQNIEMMKPIGDKLAKKYRIIIVDLPGYGASDEPSYPMSVSDYADIINKLLKEIKVSNPIIIGHSFGGKIALVYASKYQIHKLVLLASPYCPEIKKESLKIKTLKTLKKVPLLNRFEKFAKKHIGSIDYRKASDMMRKILVNTVNLDITDEVKKIKCPTLLIWGDLDTAVPVKRAYELEKLIVNSGVVVYQGCTHYAYLERLIQTINVLNSFFES